MDEQIAFVHTQRRQLYADNNIRWIPIRHHSPACAYYLMEMLDKFSPDVVLIEGAPDYESKLLAIADKGTRPPIAIYCRNSFFPLCETSPEYQAVMWGARHNKPVHFIDIPLAEKEQFNTNREEQIISEQWEGNLQYSEFVQQLTKAYGCRNSDELWERLFELREFQSSEQFFQQVFDYCAASRASYSTAALEESGDICRERCMRAFIKQNVAAHQRCIVITGGFHTPALFDYHAEMSPVPPIDVQDNWLIRYSYDRLDALNGYSAGMQAPRFYERLFSYRRYQQHQSATLNDLILSYLADLVEGEDGISLNSAVKIALCDQIIGLALLRGHAYPGLHDVKDALYSVLFKRERLEQDPLMDKINRALAGNRMGTIEIATDTVPLVANLFDLLRKNNFKLANTLPVKTTFQLYKLEDKVTKRRQLLRQCAFVGIGFGEMLSGPNWEMGYGLEKQNETWQYAWTPRVEANTVDLCHLAPDWQQLLLFKLNEAISKLSHSVNDAHKLFIRIALMGVLPLVPKLWEKLCDAIHYTSKPDELVNAVLTLLHFNSANSSVLADHRMRFAELLNRAWEQLIFTLPGIGKLEKDEALKVLVQAQEITRELGASYTLDWQEQWSERLEWLIEFGELELSIHFACRALLIEHSDADKQSIITDLTTLFNRHLGDAYNALQGIITVAPQWLLGNDNQLLLLLNSLFITWEDEVFVDSLPELRAVFSHLMPKDIEKISEQVCALNNWQEQISVFDADMGTDDVLKAQDAYKKLIAQLNAEGLSHWIRH